MKIYFTPSLLLESFKPFVGVFLKKFIKFSHKMVSRFFNHPQFMLENSAYTSVFWAIFLSYNCYYEKYSDGSVKNIQDEIPFDLPVGWSWERLSNLAAFSGGKTPSTSNRDYWGGNVLWVTSKDMKSKYIDSSLLMISEKSLEQMQLYPENTLLLVTRSGILRHTIPVAILKKPATINQDLKAIMPYALNLGEYIYICIKGMESRLILEYTKAGATVENINFDAFQKILLPIPPENQIQRIVLAVNKVDEIIVKLKIDQDDLIDIIGKTKSKILELAIQGKLVPQDENDEPASFLLERIRAERKAKLGKKYVESYIFKGDDNCYYEKVGSLTKNITAEIPFDIPNSWSWIRLSNITTLITKGTTPRGDAYTYTNSGIGFLRAENIVGFDRISKKDLKYINETTHYNFLKRSILEENDILITIAGTLGRTGMVTKEDLPLNANQAVSIVRVVNGYKIDLLYLIFVLNAPIIKKYLLSKSVEMAIPNLSLENISDCVIPLPPIQEQYNITKKISQLLDILKGGD